MAASLLNSIRRLTKRAQGFVTRGERRHARSRRARCEQLEERTLLSITVGEPPSAIVSKDFAISAEDGQIEGTVWSDRNADGLRDVGEPTLPGWTVYLDLNDNRALDAGEPSRVTDALGHYAFADLSPATYTVREVPQTAWEQTYPGPGLIVAVYDDPAFVDTSNSFEAESDTLQASLASLGYTVRTFTGTTEAEFLAGLDGADVFLLPEQETGDLGSEMDAGAKTALHDFVAGGGGMILHGFSGLADDFLNSVFGFDIADESAITAAPHAQDPGAAGTAFEDAPSTIEWHDGTAALTTASLPAGSRTIYQADPGLSAVALMPYSDGQVVFMGWDWYDAAPLGALDGGWLQVLDCAVLETSPAPVVAVYDDPAFVDTSNSFEAESDTLQASLASLGYTVRTFTGTTEAEFLAGLDGADVFLLPEQENGDLGSEMDGGAKTALHDFVAGGGGMILHGFSGLADDFLNSVFGFDIADESAITAAPHAQDPGAAGTAFEDAPSTIEWHDGTAALTTASLPAGSRTIYQADPGLSAVALMPYSDGQIVFMGWDWYDAAPLGALDGGWLQVLDCAVLETGAVSRAHTVVLAAGQVVAGKDFGNRSLSATSPDDVVVDFGSAGLWAYMDDSNWSNLHSRNAKWVAPSGENLLVDLGAPYGIYTYTRAADSYQRFHASTADGAVPRVSGAYPLETIVDFGAAYGLWCYSPESGWALINNSSPEFMLAADINADGAQEVLCDFGALGIWAWSRPNPTAAFTWQPLHSLDPVSMVAGQMDANPAADVVIDFGPGVGLWTCMNGSSWSNLHSRSAVAMAAADTNNDARSEIIVDFGSPYGLYEYYSVGAAWRHLNVNRCDSIAVADVDGSGQKDLVVDFGVAGVYLWMNDSRWRLLHGANPDSVLGIDLNPWAKDAGLAASPLEGYDASDPDWLPAVAAAMAGGANSSAGKAPSPPLSAANPTATSASSARQVADPASQPAAANDSAANCQAECLDRALCELAADDTSVSLPDHLLATDISAAAPRIRADRVRV